MKVFTPEMYRDEEWIYGIRVVDGIFMSHWIKQNLS